MALQSPDDVRSIVVYINTELNAPVPNETIHLCGLAALSIISSRPEHVLELATERLHTWPYQHVPCCWRRLFEDASLHLVAQLLLRNATEPNSEWPEIRPAKRAKLGTGDEDWLIEVVKILDRAVIISGAPGRKALIDTIFHRLDNIASRRWLGVAPQHLHITRPHPLDSPHPIRRAQKPYGIEEFQLHLESASNPVIIPATFEHWPARKLWSDMTYLKHRTIGGNRIVPVEIGTSYNEVSWTQKIMTFGEFIDKHLVPAQPREVGYLAQHDLFEQIPVLKNDISIPDYCWTTPPPPRGAAAQTTGLTSVKQLDEPLLNAWLGPAGTKTPLHTDPYHNMLCQVVGYKYIRLYAPEETPKLYPEGVDEAGINMNNTSSVDVFHFRPAVNKNESRDPKVLQDLRDRFPQFQDAQYQEAILGPGECLYVPLGYWHYVESLTPSFSVSFWWN
jgi:lysine-specific demethylase 8